MNKSIRNYTMVIQTSISAQLLSAGGATGLALAPVILTSPQPTVMPNPYTLEFDIVRDVSNTSNCTFRIYNLSPKTRESIKRDQIAGRYQQIEFYAGYGLTGNLPLCFSGFISYCISHREGTNIITTIECFGWDSQFFQFSGTLGTNTQSNIAQVAGQIVTQAQSATNGSGIPSMQLGYIGNFPGNTPNSTSYNDSSDRVINSMTSTNGPVFYTFNNQVNCLAKNHYIVNPNNFTEIDASAGLLDSPIRKRQRFRSTYYLNPERFSRKR